MLNEDFIKIKEYETFILFKNKYTGVKECFMKCDFKESKRCNVNQDRWKSKWDRI